MKHPRSDEAASLENSKKGNGQETCLQQVGEFDTCRDNVEESNVQLSDKLSAAVDTSGSKTDPVDEISPKATDNCVTVDNVSAQLAASSSSDLCVNSISLAVAEDCVPNESTKNASGRNGSVKLPLGEAERHQKHFHGAKTFQFLGSERVALLRQFLPLHPLFWNLCRKISNWRFASLRCMPCLRIWVLPLLCSCRVSAAFVDTCLTEVNIPLSRVWVLSCRNTHPNERKLRLRISLALEGQLWSLSRRVLQPRSSKFFGRPLLMSANPSVPVHLPSAQKEAWKTMLPHQVSCRFAVPQHRRIQRPTRWSHVPSICPLFNQKLRCQAFASKNAHQVALGHKACSAGRLQPANG